MTQTYEELKKNYERSTEYEMRYKAFLDLLDKADLRFLLEKLQPTDFFTAPASATNHLSEFGGLVQHILDVYAEAINLHINTYTAAKCAIIHDFVKIDLYQGKIVKKSYHWTKEEMEERRDLEKIYKDPAMDETLADLSLLDKYNLSWTNTKSWKTFLYGQGSKLRTTYDVYEPSWEIREGYLPLGHAHESIMKAVKWGVELTRMEEAIIYHHMGQFDRMYTWDRQVGYYKKNDYNTLTAIRAFQYADQAATDFEDWQDLQEMRE